MNNSIKTVIYPVKDARKAKALYARLLGTGPYMEEPYYVGFKVGDQEVGLDPNGHSRGMTSPMVFVQVADINETLQSLLKAGAQPQQPVTDVGGGKLIASVKDADGNVIGLVQPA